MEHRTEPPFMDSESVRILVVLSRAYLDRLVRKLVPACLLMPQLVPIVLAVKKIVIHEAWNLPGSDGVAAHSSQQVTEPAPFD